MCAQKYETSFKRISNTLFKTMVREMKSEWDGGIGPWNLNSLIRNTEIFQN